MKFASSHVAMKRCKRWCNVGSTFETDDLRIRGNVINSEIRLRAIQKLIQTWSETVFGANDRFQFLSWAMAYNLEWNDDSIVQILKWAH